MALKYGIVGLPNVGKSTLFNALTKGQVPAANFPFCTIDPNIGVVAVPDGRLACLTDLVNPQKTIPTLIEFVDIAGLVQGASQGEGLGNQFLAHIREMDALVHVVRCFHDEEIVHVAGQVDPVFDKAIIDYELQQKDLETLCKRRIKLEKVAKSGNKEALHVLNVLAQVERKLTQGGHARDMTFNALEWQVVQSWQLLTSKPVLYVANVDETTLQAGTNAYVTQLQAAVEQAGLILVCASLEAHLAELDLTEQALFLKEYNLATAGLPALIRASYALLDLITYFTAGPKEVRAWTIRRGTKAPQAAGVIHSDLERDFIKAEVIKLADYQAYRTELACREAGKVRIEGKEYGVVDGDIMHFRCRK